MGEPIRLTICQMLATSDCMEALNDGTCPNEFGCDGCIHKERYEEGFEEEK